MTRSYYLQKECPAIHLAVKVSTPGDVTTRVVKKRSGGVSETLAEAKKADGIIKKTNIGSGDKLSGSVLDITTTIELGLLAKNVWDNAYENVVVEYTLDGGIDGEQVYEFDLDDKSRSNSKMTILIKKAIKLITV